MYITILDLKTIHNNPIGIGIIVENPINQPMTSAHTGKT